jgi:hypothetical protein
MKRIAIAVIAILPAISLYSLWLLVSSHDTEDIYFDNVFSMDKEEDIEHLDAIAEKDKFIFMPKPCSFNTLKECNDKEDALPVGSVVGFNFTGNAYRTRFIGQFCKLDTVTVSEQHFQDFGGDSHFRGVCEIVEKRELTVF